MTRPMRLLLVRHGQTTANVSGSLDTGVPGPHLTDLGRRQASSAAQALAAEDYRSIYVSELIRTHQTAEPLAQARELTTIRQRGLEEINAGELEKRTDDEAVSRYLETISDWIHGDLDLAMPGSETGHEFLARYDAAIARIAAAAQPDGQARQAAGGSALVVSHGAAIRTWVASRIPDSNGHPEATKMLYNTACITLEGHPELGWDLIDWQSEPVGGRYLEDDSAADPTSEPITD